MTENIRVRFAPSPTGYLHVGGARTALFNWLYCRKHDGKFILRIEDTDLVRSEERMVGQILDSMKWLGLDWDEGPFYQSERFSLYDAAVDKLLSEGKAYHCFCDAEKLKVMREEARKKGGAFRYDRRCLHLSDEEKQRLTEEGVPKAVRFLVPEGETAVSDAVHGDVSFNHKEIGDFVIKKADGSPTYQLAVVVDDHDMAITHVIRGDDHYNNIPKQVMIYKALGYELPIFAHIPLILAPDRSKLSKRNAAVAVSDYEEAGFMPEAVRNFLALLGWSPGDNREIMTLDELVEAFDLPAINKANAVFDVKKLEWMNNEYVKLLPKEDLFARVKPILIASGLTDEDFVANNAAWVEKIILLLQERVRKLTDYPEAVNYFFNMDFDYDEKGVRKQFKGPETAHMLAQLVARFEAADDFSLETIETIIRELAEGLDVGAGKIIHPARLACSGLTVGPSLFHLVEALGKERTIARLKRAIEYIKAS
ncbi:MAG: glutamate--tRNA ligase [Candidatus Coatesbacteria bacterium]|nr:glutamate--tRNA ligase [Candidatus Coatesbacteria bacterium]